MQDALALIDDWPVERAAAAVVDTHGVVAHRGPMDAPFELASVTKLLSAHAVLVAVEEGTLALDQPAGPEGSTIRHLLAHASGLSPEGRELAAPGTRRIYANAGYDVLGIELTRHSGMEFDDYLREAVLGPLGMPTTELRGSPAFAGVGTVADLARYAGELLTPRLLAPETAADATSVQFPGLTGVLPGYGRQDPNDWGLGPELRATKSPHWTAPGSSPRTFGHFGASGTFLWVDPEPGLAMVCLTDRNFGEWALDRWPALTTAVLAAR
ncbi:MAG: serine hydrolase domain-containing protein [Actinomycetota bacterium]